MDAGTTTGQLALTLGNAEALLPPFRSAKDFPVSPKAQRLSELYPACRQALVDANAARALLKQRMAQKKDVIAVIQAEIERLEQDLALEASTRLQLHAVNKQLVAALGEMEKMVDEVTNTITAAHGGKRTGLKVLVDRLKLLVQRWRAFKLNQRAVIAEALSVGHDDGSSR